MLFLRALGCDQLQGFLFSPGVVAQEFARLVQTGARLNMD
jgi:EAL domain-containing protein (putative c-di-GMP-specific phosphodiesterase class I)